MHTLDELTVRLLSELIEIAEGLGLKNAKKESKKDLIYKILDIQATLPESEVSAPIAEKEIKTAPKKRPPNPNTKKVNQPTATSRPPEVKDGTSKLLASLDLNLKDGDKKEIQPAATNTPVTKVEAREKKPLNQEKTEKKRNSARSCGCGGAGGGLGVAISAEFCTLVSHAPAPPAEGAADLQADASAADPFFGFEDSLMQEAAMGNMAQPLDVLASLLRN